MFSVVSNMETEEAKTVTQEEKLVDFKGRARRGGSLAGSNRTCETSLANSTEG
jgi:hypothetical protein